MKSEALKKLSKLKMYRNIIRPVVTHASETWILTQKDEQYLGLLKMFVPVQNNDCSWRIRRNYEMTNLVHDADIVKFIKSRRIAWLGHTVRMDTQNSQKISRTETSR